MCGCGMCMCWYGFMSVDRGQRSSFSVFLTHSLSYFLSHGPSLSLEFSRLAVANTLPSESSLQAPIVEPFWKEQDYTVLSHGIITH